MSKISDLTPDAQNARAHNPRNVGMIVNALHEVGAARSIVIDEDGNILAGNATIEAAAEAGIENLQIVEADGETIVAVRRTGLTDAQKTRLKYFDNRTAELADWDSEQVLADLEAGVDLDGLFTDIELEDFGWEPDKAEDPGADMDRAQELQEKWGVKRGDLWEMVSREGSIKHTLFCGDAASANIDCKIAIYDPPFDWSVAQQDMALSWVKWDTAILMGLANCMPLAARHDLCHWWIWDSGMARFAGKGYKPMSGCAIVFAFGQKRNWHEGQGLAALDRADVAHYDFPTQVVAIQDSLGGQDHERRQKPYALLDYIISLYSEANDCIGDPFAGTGTALIACENLKRRYCGSEIILENCAVILDRYAEAFDIKPTAL